MTRVLIAIVCLFAVCGAWQVDLVFNTSQTGNFTVNFQGEWTINLTTSKALSLCLQRYAMVTSNSSLWKQSCTHYAQFKASKLPQIQSFSLRYVLYQFAIQPDNSSDTSTVTGTMSGLSCDYGQVWNGSACQAVLPYTTSFNLGAEPVFFNFTILRNTGTVLIEPTKKAGEDADCEVTLDGKFSAVPFDDESDFNVTTPGSIVVKLPRAGTWIVRATSTTGCFNINFTVKVTPVVCPDNFGGVDCKTRIISDQIVLNQELGAGETAYFITNSSLKTPLIAVARSVDGLSVPRIFASLDQIPDVNSNSEIASDFDGCNQADCELTTRIVLDPEPLDQTWYVAVKNTGNSGNNFSVWFNGICPPACSIRGTCSNSGPRTGECTCLAQDFSGLDCNTVTLNLTLLFYLAILGGSFAVIGAFAALSVLCLRSSRPVFRSEYSTIQ